MNITFISAPAAGKGLLSSMINEKYGYPHISIGDLLRGVDDEKVKKQLENGEFVDNGIIAKLLSDRLSRSDCKEGFILDGFPRNMSQISIYEEVCEKANNKKNVIIVLDIPREIGEKRILGRRVCLNCGNVFNIMFENSKPKVSGICDHCGHKLIQRTDDNLETYENRYDTFLKETKPVIDYFEARGNVYHVDGSGSSDETFSDIEKIIGGYND
ncbi:adenylate kinase [Firmicutes bacterium CAG:822]|nr:adenylate kinase [Firmicutes bacterium CAG:822]